MERNKKFVIIDYGMGNLRSVLNAFVFLGLDAAISNRREDMFRADAIVLPGVGAFGEAVSNLNRLGIRDSLDKRVLEDKVPYLGICLGMQLVSNGSEEGGYHRGFGWISGETVRIPVAGSTRLPHIGWNDIKILKKEPLFESVNTDMNFYFVHSFFVDCDPEYISAVCSYDVEITAALQKDNIFATQFHPERSQENGLRVLRAFANFTEGYDA